MMTFYEISCLVSEGLGRDSQQNLILFEGGSATFKSHSHFRQGLTQA